MQARGSICGEGHTGHGVRHSRAERGTRRGSTGLFDAGARGVHESRAGKAASQDDVLLLMADKDVEYSVLSKVMKTAAMAGYPNFHLVAQRK